MSFTTTIAQLSFDKLREIGQDGKNSKVFLAKDHQLDADIVIKEIDKKCFNDISEYFREANKLYASEHPSVVQLKYACEDSHHVYIGMPFYKNGSIKSIMGTRFLTVREIIRYSIQFLSGVHHIHVKGLIHFDIKPDNILITDSNEAVISDFGLTKNMDSLGLSSVGKLYSKHLPPEVFIQSLHSMQYDVYGSGATLYRMCNGNDLFEAQFSKHTSVDELKKSIQSGKFPDRNEYLPHIPNKLRRIINTAMSVNPDHRYDTILDLINDLTLVNELLDWKYTVHADKKTWEIQYNDKIFVVSLRLISNTYEIVTTKYMIASGVTNRVHAHCHAGLSPKTVGKRIQKILLSL